MIPLEAVSTEKMPRRCARAPDTVKDLLRRTVRVAGLWLCVSVGCSTATPRPSEPAISENQAGPRTKTSSVSRTSSSSDPVRGRSPGGPRLASTVKRCEETSSELEAIFARKYRERYCRMCSEGVGVAPIPLSNRTPPDRDILERTAAGVRGPRRRVVLYYFSIPCAPCDELLPFVHAVMRHRRPQDIEVIPVMDIEEEDLKEEGLLSDIEKKFPQDLERLAGVFRDAAPFEGRLRKVMLGTPATVIFSGPELSKVRTLYGAAQKRFWEREAERARSP